jgi:WW domain-containing oxidoreductase
MAESMAYKKHGINFDDMTGEKEYSPWGAYGQSKLANLLFARELSKRLPEGQVCNSVHPGVAATELSRNMDQGPIAKFIFGTLGPMIALKSVGACAATQTYLAVHPDAKGITGKYWASCNVSTPSPHGQDDELAARMWKETEALVNSLEE